MTLTRGSETRLWAVVTVLLTLLVTATVVLRGWLSDDAFITLRTIDNLVHGLGPRWNPSERVQTFTHPLWLFLLTLPYWVTREPYYTTLAVGLVASFGMILLVIARIANDWRTATNGLLLLFASRSF